MNRRLLAGMVAAMTLVACTPSAPEPTPSPSPTVVHMRTERADGYTFDPAEGWDESRREHENGAIIHEISKGDEKPRAKLQLRRRTGREALKNLESFNKDIDDIPPDLAVDPQLILQMRMEVAQLGGQHSPGQDLQVLPTRTVGGETALGFSYVESSPQGQISAEEWAVVRHDGVWEFTLWAATDDTESLAELHQMLDSFRWTGPRPVPTATPS